MDAPIIYYDPTSEPCRAVYWLCLAANIPHQLHHTWLTRDEHLADEFLKINPMHQVPALKHGDFCLSEATAIMQYLTDINGCTEIWFGADVKQNALINKHLSWYHTNLRKILSLDYFLPVLLMPAYIGATKPADAEIATRKTALHRMLKQLDSMLNTNRFLAGDAISAADILFASDMLALKIDPELDNYLGMYIGISDWLARLQTLSSYRKSHAAWDHVAPLIMRAATNPKSNPEWVAQACEQLNT